MEKLSKIWILAKMDKENVKECSFSFPMVLLVPHEDSEDHDRLLAV